MIYRCKSNAKINVSLKIVGMESGYHLLNSVFVPIDLCDEIEFSESDEIEIIGFDIPQEQNIIYKTIQYIIKKEQYLRKGIKVVCKKHIPMMAGLGGGSSNAAFTIKALNELWRLKYTLETKMFIASEIGSDVPFFIINSPSYVTGFGENIQPIEMKPIKGILIYDGFGFNTAKIYKNYDLLNISFDKNYPKFNKKIDYVNSLEKAITSEEGYQKVVEAISLLKENGATVAMMSGSGSSTFGLFEDDKVLEKAYNNLKDKFKFVYVFYSINND